MLEWRIISLSLSQMLLWEDIRLCFTTPSQKYSWCKCYAVILGEPSLARLDAGLAAHQHMLLCLNQVWCLLFCKTDIGITWHWISMFTILILTDSFRGLGVGGERQDFRTDIYIYIYLFYFCPRKYQWFLPRYMMIKSCFFQRFRKIPLPLSIITSKQLKLFGRDMMDNGIDIVRKSWSSYLGGSWFLSKKKKSDV